MRKQFIIAAAVLLTAGINYCQAATTDSAQPDLRAERLKKLYRRDPRAQNLVPAVEQIIAADASKDASVKRRKDFLELVIIETGTTSEDRLREDVDVLEKMTSTVAPLEDADKKEIQDQYAKVAALLEDQIFIKDLDNALMAHDRLIKHTALGNYNKAKIQDELKRIEQLVQDAPPIPYGRSELLRNLQEKRLLAPNKGAYVGLLSNEQNQLSTIRRSVGDLDEGTSAAVQIDSADMIIQGPDGSLVDLTSANHPYSELALSPPLSLWMKTRLLEGRIPAITFRPVDKPTRARYGASGVTLQSNYMSVQDVLDGKLDDYFKRNFETIASTKAPTMVGLLGSFDREAATAFGADGRTPYYLLADPKLAKLPADKLDAQLEARLAKGGLVKDTGVELRRYYGDPTLPDGPERTRDAWKRIQKIAAQSASPSTILYATTGSNHGNKKGLALDPYAGAQDWNKLQYYWPGDGVLQWAGTAERVIDAAPPAGTAAAIQPFVQEAQSSNWQSLPLFIRDFGPPAALPPAQEAAWISGAVQDLMQLKHPELKAVFLAYPEGLSLQTSEARGAMRRAVGSNPYFKQKLRLQDLSQ
jgi:hypothetical protein